MTRKRIFLVVASISMVGSSHGVGHGGDMVGYGHGGGVGSVGGVGGLDLLAGSLGDLVVNIDTRHLGDSVAVLNLHGDSDDLGVVHTVLSDDLPAGVLHGSGHGVGHGMGSHQRSVVGDGNGGSGVVGIASITVVGIGISLGLSLSLTLVHVVGSRGITQDIDHILADLLILDLLSLNGLGGADILSDGGASLGHEDLGGGNAVGSGDSDSMASMVGEGMGSQVLGVSLSVRGGGGTSQGQEARDSKDLHLV